MTAAIRAAAPADAALLAALHGRCFADHWREAAFRTFLEDEAVFGFLAAPDSTAEFSGFVIARAAAGEAELLTAGTVPESRGQGLATELLRRTIAEAWRRGAEKLFLEVAEDNRAAIALYEKLGFEPVGKRPGYYAGQTGPALAAVVMRLPLADG